MARHIIIASVFIVTGSLVAQNTSAGMADLTQMNPTILIVPDSPPMLIPTNEISANQSATMDYNSPAREVFMPGLEQSVEVAGLTYVPVPQTKPQRRAVGAVMTPAAKTRPAVRVVRAKFERKLSSDSKVIRISDLMQPIIGAYR